MNKILRSTPIRKAISLINYVPRTVSRLGAGNESYQKSPPVLANSFPKSGTHLLLQILDALPNTRSYGAFLASMPSITFRERSRQNHLRAIRRIAPGELIPAHLFYHPAYNEELSDINCVQYFILRDPRDVAISEAHYLTYMTRWHRMHNHFANTLDSDEERIAEAIAGVQNQDFPYDYPDIRERFLRYRGWLEAEDVLLLRYEELRSSGLEDALRRITGHYQTKTGTDLDVEGTIDMMTTNIDPERSHTFRRGELGQWREVFTERLKVLMKSVAGDLLIDLGYEQDHGW